MTHSAKLEKRSPKAYSFLKFPEEYWFWTLAIILLSVSYNVEPGRAFKPICLGHVTKIQPNFLSNLVSPEPVWPIGDTNRGFLFLDTNNSVYQCVLGFKNRSMVISASRDRKVSKKCKFRTLFWYQSF